VCFKTGSLLKSSFEDALNFTETAIHDQVKDKLTNDKTKIILIYPRNIVNNKLILSDHTEKKQYIDIDKEIISGPLIIINRIIGVKDITLKPLLIEKGSYLFENHMDIFQLNNQIKKNYCLLINPKDNYMYLIL
jgi:hypothetical protein